MLRRLCLARFEAVRLHKPRHEVGLLEENCDLVIVSRLAHGREDFLKENLQLVVEWVELDQVDDALKDGGLKTAAKMGDLEQLIDELDELQPGVSERGHLLLGRACEGDQA